MKKAAIDPADWLAATDIKGYLDATFADPLELGREALALADGDLLAACRQQEDLRAEIVLAWLAARAAEDGPAATDGIMLAARIVGRVNARA